MPERCRSAGFMAMYKRDGQKAAETRSMYPMCRKTPCFRMGSVKKVIRKNGVTEDVRRENSIVRGKLV